MCDVKKAARKIIKLEQKRASLDRQIKMVEAEIKKEADPMLYELGYRARVSGPQLLFIVGEVLEHEEPVSLRQKRAPLAQGAH